MMMEGIYYVEPNIMNVINSVHIDSEQKKRMKQKSTIHDTAMVHIGDQQRIHMMGQYNKGKHVSFEDVGVVAEAEAQKYVSISEEEVRIVVEKEKINKTPKRNMSMGIALPLDDEDFIYVEEYMLTRKKKKSKIGEFVKIISNNEEQSESSKVNK